MNAYERVICALEHREGDRIPQYDAFWGTTIERWQREGLPADVPLDDYFDWDLAGISSDESMRFPTETLEETDAYRITRNGDGAIVKNWTGRSSTPEMIDFTIKTRADWEAYRERMCWDEARVDWAGQRAAYARARAAGRFTFAGFYTGFTRTCDMCGTDTLLMAMADDPDWVRAMFMARAEVCLATAEELLARGIDVDAVWIYDDLGFKQRSFFSTGMYRELVMPAHRRLCDFFKGRGKFTILHSCGYVKELLPALIETGFDCLQPLEVKAGNDLLAYKRDFGERLAFMGGIDVRAMADADPAVIAREIAEKLPAAKAGGGYLYHSDHSIPDDVSLAQYRRVMELVAEHGRY